MQNIDCLLNEKNIHLTEQQYLAATHVEGPALVLAVPGAGKTTTIMIRIANLVLNHNVSPDKILAITFSKASALDMTKRFNSLFSDKGIENVKFSTIHAFGNWVVSSYNRRFNIVSRLITQREVISVIKNAYHTSTKKYLSEDSLENYTTAISYIKNRMLTEDETAEYIKSTKVDALTDVIDGYETYKKENNLYDYDDMLLNCIDILKNNKVTLNYLQNKYEHIIIDEAQDTSLLQYEIVSLLSNHKPSTKKNVYMVGDDDQNIYGFRGVDNSTILKINKRFPGIKTYYMENNFRSQSKIVDVSNTLISKNKNRYTKTIKATRSASSDINIVQAKNFKEQTDYILNKIKNTEGSVAILYRNNISAVGLANELNEGNIDFCASNYKPGFFNHWVTKDIISIINILLDESDADSFSNIYYKIESYLSKNIIAELKKSKGKFDNLFSYLISNCSLNKRQKETVIFIERLFKKARKKSPKEGLNYILSASGYFSFLRDKSSSGDSSSLIQVAETIVEIAGTVNNYSDILKKFSDLNELLNKSRENKSSRICLSTLHSAKGLEFDTVFIVNANDDVIPAEPDRRLSKEESVEFLEGERRLFFVGVTRAKNNLHIISTSYKSMFVEDIEKCKEVINKIKINNN